MTVIDQNFMSENPEERDHESSYVESVDQGSHYEPLLIKTSEADVLQQSYAKIENGQKNVKQAEELKYKIKSMKMCTGVIIVSSLLLFTISFTVITIIGVQHREENHRLTTISEHVLSLNNNLNKLNSQVISLQSANNRDAMQNQLTMLGMELKTNISDAQNSVTRIKNALSDYHNMLKNCYNETRHCSIEPSPNGVSYCYTDPLSIQTVVRMKE